MSCHRAQCLVGCIGYSCKEPAEFCTQELDTGINLREKGFPGAGCPENRNSWVELLSLTQLQKLLERDFGQEHGVTEQVGMAFH